MLMNIIAFLIGLIGLSAICYGAWSVFEPAGFIVGGVFMLWWSYLASSSMNSLPKKKHQEES